MRNCSYSLSSIRDSSMIDPAAAVDVCVVVVVVVVVVDVAMSLLLPDDDDDDDEDNEDDVEGITLMTGISKRVSFIFIDPDDDGLFSSSVCCFSIRIVVTALLAGL